MQTTLKIPLQERSWHALDQIMALYLCKGHVLTIMSIRQWSNNAFLLYILRKIQEILAGISADMVSQGSFFTIPDIDIEDDQLNPRNRNNQSFASTISLNGPNASTKHVERPSMHVWH